MAETDLKVIVKAKELAVHSFKLTSNCNPWELLPAGPGDGWESKCDTGGIIVYIVVTLLALVVGALISRVITVHQVRRGRVRACGRIYRCKDSGPAG